MYTMLRNEKQANQPELIDRLIQKKNSKMVSRTQPWTIYSM